MTRRTRASGADYAPGVPDTTISDPFAALSANAHGVLCREVAADAFGYADGSEAHLLDLMQAVGDRSSASAELPALATDWATTYHLSPSRWTLVDTLDLEPGRVLELGAGCGAVTTRLAEHHHAVDAVEGSPARAAIVRARCRDHENVRVVAGDLSAFAPAPRYDVVTLIGVLEYARCFGETEGLPPREATRRVLDTARRWLAPGGVLIVAIENQFGLKYLAGHVEDHTGRPFDGLHGYRAPGTAVTFTRAQLEADMAAVGLSVDELLLPFPDYKLPETFINARRPHPGAASWISTPWVERGTDRIPATFNEALAVSQAESGGLLTELSNSFLLMARATADARGPQLPWHVRHYTVGRQPAFRKRKTLVERDGQPVVLVESLAGAARPSAAFDAIGYQQHLEDEPHVAGTLLAERLLGGDPATAPERIADLLRVHAGWLVERFAFPAAAQGTALDPGLTLAATAFDAHPLNVIVDEHGTWTPIDLEWRPTRPLTLGEATWRAAHVLLVRWRAYLLPDEPRAPAEMAALLAAQALGVEPHELPWRSASTREELFQDAVRGAERAGKGLAGRLAGRQQDLRLTLLGVQSEYETVLQRLVLAERERDTLLGAAAERLAAETARAAEREHELAEALTHEQLAAEHAARELQRVRESVSWRGLQRARGVLHRALGGPDSRASRTLGRLLARAGGSGRRDRRS